MVKRDDRLSYLRAIACVAIVVLHTFYIANITFTESYSLAGNITSNAIRNLMLWAVPNFLMISGALSLDPAKDITIKKIFSKYITRIFLALVFFCVIYQVFDSIFINDDFGIASILLGIREALFDESWSTTWYLYQLIGLYLMLPIYRLVTKHATDSQIRYLLAIYLIFTTILPVLRIWGINLGFTINVSTVYPFYFFAGYAIYSGALRISKKTGMLLVIIGSLLTILLTSYRYMANQEALDFFKNYNAINVVIQSVGVFAMIFGVDERTKSKESALPKDDSHEPTSIISKVILNFDENSFGVYLIHIIFIKWLFRVVNFDPYTHMPGLSFIGIIIALTLVSWLITFILRLIPFVRKVL